MRALFTEVRWLVSLPQHIWLNKKADSLSFLLKLGSDCPHTRGPELEKWRGQIIPLYVCQNYDLGPYCTTAPCLTQAPVHPRRHCEGVFVHLFAFKSDTHSNLKPLRLGSIEECSHHHHIQPWLDVVRIGMGLCVLLPLISAVFSDNQTSSEKTESVHVVMQWRPLLHFPAHGGMRGLLQSSPPCYSSPKPLWTRVFLPCPTKFSSLFAWIDWVELAFVIQEACQCCPLLFLKSLWFLEPPRPHSHFHLPAVSWQTSAGLLLSSGNIWTFTVHWSLTYVYRTIKHVGRYL